MQHSFFFILLHRSLLTAGRGRDMSLDPDLLEQLHIKVCDQPRRCTSKFLCSNVIQQLLLSFRKNAQLGNIRPYYEFCFGRRRNYTSSDVRAAQTAVHISGSQACPWSSPLSLLSKEEHSVFETEVLITSDPGMLASWANWRECLILLDVLRSRMSSMSGLTRYRDACSSLIIQSRVN